MRELRGANTGGAAEVRGELRSARSISRRTAFLLYWLPVFLWMGVMFEMSTEAGSTRHTSRIIRPILRWFNPEVSDETIRSVQLVIRKTAHITEYAVLSWLLWRARRKPRRGDGRGWNRSDAFLAFALAILFAVSDEWHQSFVPSREAQFHDVLFDASGAALGLLVAWGAGRRRKAW